MLGYMVAAAITNQQNQFKFELIFALLSAFGLLASKERKQCGSITNQSPNWPIPANFADWQKKAHAKARTQCKQTTLQQRLQILILRIGAKRLANEIHLLNAFAASSKKASK